MPAAQTKYRRSAMPAGVVERTWKKFEFSAVEKNLSLMFLVYAFICAYLLCFTVNNRVNHEDSKDLFPQQRYPKAYLRPRKLLPCQNFFPRRRPSPLAIFCLTFVRLRSVADVPHKSSAKKAVSSSQPPITRIMQIGLHGCTSAITFQTAQQAAPFFLLSLFFLSL